MAILNGCNSELELEDLPVSRLLSPTVNQFKQTVVRPNTRTNFFVDADSLCWCYVFLILACSFSEQSVLGEGATRITLLLIDLFWMGAVHRPRNIMPFIHQHPAFIFHPIRVWSARADTHQNSAL